MSIATVITEGFGSFGDVAHVVTDGYDISAAAPPPPPSDPAKAALVTQAFGGLSDFSPYVVTEGYRASSVAPPPPPPPAPVVTVQPSGGYFGPVGRRRTPEHLRKDRERFGVIEAAAEIVNDVAIRQAEQPGLDAAQQLAELQGELGARGIPVSSEYISLLERLRARYEADALEERDIVFVMSAIVELDE